MNERLRDREIDKPLGLPGQRQRPSSGRGFGREEIVYCLVGLALVVSSSLIAFRERPYRTPPQVVVTTPETIENLVSGAPEAPAAYPSSSGSSSGPAIIKVPKAAESGNGGIIVRDPTAKTGQDPRVAHLPDRDLVEESDYGLLPIRAADGRRPFDVYARPWSGARGARVAIVIGGLGVSQTGTQEAISKLPPEVTLAFASGGNSLDRWMQTARQKGHEIVLQVPLEPFDYPSVDPGRNTLTVDADAEENRDRLYATLGRITNYTGVMNYMGGRFVTDRAAFSPFMAELGKRGLMYLDDGSSARTLAPELALVTRVPYAAADLTIDTEREHAAVLEKLDDAERTARAKGYAVATGSAFSATVDAVSVWAQEAKRRGIEIVPVSALARDPEME